MSEYWKLNRRINEMKKDIPLPAETCPIVDEAIKLLEGLRQDNADMRTSAKEWFHLVEELHTMVGELEDKLDEKEKKIDELENEVSKLESQLT